ncbi:hypothetical protein ACN24M_04115 [Streptomyces microflavus]|uniref:hypothetical protein n=1 Tax=Streptomyces sp. CB02130 TaxID=1703934 RepID=UPI0013011696|nr:hypothetical protein [Streptomyces sp. CB02130]
MQRQLVRVVPALGVPDLLGPALVERPSAGEGAVHDRHDVVPLALDLSGSFQGGIDAAQAPEILADRPPEVIGTGGCGANPGQYLGAVSEEDLDVFPRLGVAYDLAVRVALLVHRPTVVVAEVVRDGVPGVFCLLDSGRSGGQCRDVLPPRHVVVACR